MDSTKLNSKIIKPKVLIMSGYGINCETESAHAFEKANADVEIVHINDLISRKKSLKNYDILFFPGGFSYGDDTSSGNAFANKIKNNLWNELKQFIDDKKLILGICNGFQIMSNLGLFATVGNNYGERNNALLSNDNNRYETRWVNLIHEESICVFTKGIKLTHIPIAHGEGKFYCDEKTLNELKKNKQIVFRYCHSNGTLANGEFPLNPNGALNDIAGICDKSGRILGMMPHPERGLYSISEPNYHKKKIIEKNKNEFIESNFKIFKNSVNYVIENKKG
jgi:phosphoribosylformylglycinamidine synthase subunit PurQ / glutaminase